MLVDEIELVVKAGDGGRGKVSFAKAERGPDGGNGGKGGDVYAMASSDLTLLAQYLPLKEVSAEKGVSGGKDKMFGRNAEDLILQFPVGTHFVDIDTNEEFELKYVGKQILLCKGGKAGIGNFELRSSKLTTPKFSIPPTPGQVRNLKITLKFIADFGLIGLPSSGKSSLLNALTNAHVKTAAYHFTTLSPNLGVLPNKKILADIPGLIEGASEGRGLGVKFLKHIQKVSLLLHCISCDSPDPLKDYKTVRTELKKFDENLMLKEEIILLTKSDLSDLKMIEGIIKKLKSLKRKTIPVSIHNMEELDNLQKVLK